MPEMLKLAAARAALGPLIESVHRQGKTFYITRGTVPVAAIVPVTKEAGYRVTHLAALDALPDLPESARVRLQEAGIVALAQCGDGTIMAVRAEGLKMTPLQWMPDIGIRLTWRIDDAIAAGDFESKVATAPPPQPSPTSEPPPEPDAGAVLMIVRPDTPLKLFHWSKHAWTCLTRNGFWQAGQLAGLSEKEVMRMDGVGRVVAPEILGWIGRVTLDPGRALESEPKPKPQGRPLLPQVPVEPVVTVAADTPIGDLGLSIRLTNSLIRYGLRTCGDLVDATWPQVKDFRQVGPKQEDELRDAVRHLRVVSPERASSDRPAGGGGPDTTGERGGSIYTY